MPRSHLHAVGRFLSSAPDCNAASQCRGSNAEDRHGQARRCQFVTHERRESVPRFAVAAAALLSSPSGSPSERRLEYAAPQVRDTPEPFISSVRAALAGRTRELERLTVELYARGLSTRDIEDGAPGIIRAIEECFPRSARQRCLARRMRNLAAKVPTDPWPEFKTRVAACYQAPSRAIARQLAVGIRADYTDLQPSAFICFDDDFGACIAHQRLPVTHRRFARTTNLLERLFVEERRRLKIRRRQKGTRPGIRGLDHAAGKVIPAPRFQQIRALTGYG
jgi:Transposase, Mutator family